MGILFRLSYAQLLQPGPADDLAQGILQILGGKGHRHIQGGVVLGHAGVMNPHGPGGKFPEIPVYKGPGDLPGPVGTEVKEDDAVAVLNQPPAIHQGGLEKFIVLPPGVALLHRLNRRDGGMASPIGQAAVGLLHPLPASIPVHGEVAAGDCSHPAGADAGDLLFQLPDVGEGASGGNIPAIQDGMDINFLKAHLCRHLQEGKEMGYVAVHAAVGEKADKMQICLFCLLHCIEQDGIFRQGAILHRQADPGIILVDDPASADVEVAHFGVAHLAAGQAHRQAGGGQGGGGVVFPESLQVGLFCPGHGIVLFFRADTKAVHDYDR